MHHAAETIAPLNTAIKRVSQRPCGRCRQRRPEIQSPMWPVRVVMIDEDRDCAFKMRLV
jgi:hypothetical protein